MKWRIFLLLSIFFLSLTGVAYAADSSWDYFQVDTSKGSEDLSVQYLIAIFGSMGNVLAADAGSVTTFGQMFGAFNIIALGIGVSMVTYTVALGILNTAESGKFLGEKLSSIWIPIRTAIGTALLVPAAGPGYCMAQLIMMWLILNGVGAANTVWDFAVTNFSIESQGVSGNHPSTAEMDAGYNMLYAIMKSEACVRVEQSRPTGAGSVERVKYPTAYDVSAPQASVYYSDVSTLPPNNVCGQFTFRNVDETNFAQSSAQDKTTKSRKASYGLRDAAFSQMSLPKGQSGVTLAAAPGDYMTMDEAQKILGMYIDLAVGFPAAPPGVVLPSGRTATYNAQWAPYIDAVRSWVYSYVKNIKEQQAGGIPLADAPSNTSDTDAKEEILKSGWLTAGFYYFKLVALAPTAEAGGAASRRVDVNGLRLPGTAENIPDMQGYSAPEYNAAVNQILVLMGALNPNATKSGPTVPGTVNPLNDPMLTYGPQVAGNYPGAASNNISTPNSNQLTTSNEDMSSFINQVAGDSRSGANFTNPAAQTIFGYLRGSWTTTLSGLRASITDTENRGDPIVGLMRTGSMMMRTASDMVMTLMIVLPIAGLVAGVCTSQLPFGDMLQAVLTTVIPVLYLLYGVLYTEGALLGVYLPMIPLVSFIVGGIGWLTAVIEAMVAAPIIAVALTIPEGQHDILGKAEPAFMMVMNLMLRPVLMVIGFITAIFLLRIAINLTNVGFVTVFNSGGIQADYLFGPLVILGAYVAIVVSVVQKVFGLITHLPDRTLSWIGDHSAGYGNADQMLGEAKAATKEQAGALGKTEAVAKGAAKVGQKAGKGMKKMADNAKKDDDGMKLT